MKTFGCDFGHGKKLVVYDPDTDAYHNPPSLLAFIEQNPGCRVVTECSFDNWFRQRRNETIRRAKELGVDLRVFANRASKNYRLDHGLVKDDEIDAKALYTMWREGRHTAPPRETTESAASFADKAQIASRMGWRGKEAEEILKYLPANKDVPQNVKEVLGNGKTLSRACAGILAATALDVLSRGGGVRPFNDAVGIHEHGWPGRPRAAVHHARLTALRKRVAGIKPVKGIKGSGSVKGLRDKEVRAELLSEIRRASRWLFAQVRKRYKGFPSVA